MLPNEKPKEHWERRYRWTVVEELSDFWRQRQNNGILVCRYVTVYDVSDDGLDADGDTAMSEMVWEPSSEGISE